MCNYFLFVFICIKLDKMSWDILKEEIYEKWKSHWFQIHPHDIADYSWNYLFTGGKQIRSKLFCELWAYLAPDMKINAELAFAIECIHVASLILDDTPWMDNASERRGKKTLHNVLSPKKAVLVSYELINIVRDIWLNNKPIHVSDEFWQNFLKIKLQRLVIGQLYDIEKKGNLVELASLKTGVLFELVTETVAICIGLDTEFWKIWGNNIGILFQWMDDWNDREEDITQHNRNAFNEDYHLTLKNYEYLWSKIKNGIGKQWFLRPFGIFMKQYFTENIPINLELNTQLLTDNISISYITTLTIPKIEYSLKKDIILNFLNNDILNATDILKQLFIGFDNININIINIKTNLWYVDENEWDKLDEIKELIHHIQQK